MTQLTRAAVLCIGTELTRGEIQNTNATWLAQRLTELGLEVTGLDVVADDRDAIAGALERLAATHRLVAVTGGLGPTTDDITSLSAAAWLGVPQERDPVSLAAIRERLTRLGRSFTESNARQADFPAGARVLENPNGTAPGFSLERRGCTLFFMPGVPREMRPMFERYLVPEAQRYVQGAQHQVHLHCFGLPESVLNDRLQGLEASHGVRIGYRAHFPEVEVKLLAIDAHASAAEARARTAAVEARRRLGAAVYGEGDVDLALVTAELLRARGLTLALAESCTGGLVSSLLTRHPASDYLLGAVVSYANSAKVALLGVDTAALEAHGAVSAVVAAQMAEGARRRFGADLGLSLTGIAGPTGATPDKPVGLVHYALATPGGTLVRDVTLRERPRQQVQVYSAWCALDLIRQQLAPALTPSAPAQK